MLHIMTYISTVIVFGCRTTMIMQATRPIYNPPKEVPQAPKSGSSDSDTTHTQTRRDTMEVNDAILNMRHDVGKSCALCHPNTRRWVVHPMPEMSGQLVHHLQYWVFEEQRTKPPSFPLGAHCCCCWTLLVEGQAPWDRDLLSTVHFESIAFISHDPLCR